MSELVTSFVRPDGVGELRLSRAAKRNALNHALVDQALDAMDAFTAKEITVAVLSADPPIFCAGNDLREARANRDRAAADRFVAALRESPLFWIAALGGPALGAGASVAAVCPVVVAVEDAWLALPELEIGLFPAGVVPYLEPFIGARRALTLGMTGERLSAAEAVAAGLYTEIAGPADFDGRVAGWCATATARPQVTDAARRAWQARFVTAGTAERAAQLQQVLDSQTFGTEEAQA